jgi:hypothetical protein
MGTQEGSSVQMECFWQEHFVNRVKDIYGGEHDACLSICDMSNMQQSFPTLLIHPQLQNMAF